MKNTTLPELPSHIGKRGRLVLPPDKAKLFYTITDEICLPQSDMPEKILCLQHIEFEKDKRIEVRLGYYIIGKATQDARQVGLGTVCGIDAASGFSEACSCRQKRKAGFKD